MSTHDQTFSDDAVAIVGMAGRFPGADDVPTFWRNLLDGKEGVSHFSDAEIDDAIPEQLRKNPAYVSSKGIIEHADEFDAGFFGVSPLEADVMDPQQRILLQLAWHTFEDAGYVPGDDNRVAVFVGTNWNTYVQDHILPNADLLKRFGRSNAMLANQNDFPATRLSYKLNLKGPSISVFTACSTGLVTVCQAVQSLINFECDSALAGGASMALPQRQGYLYSDGGMFAKDGHCRPFDAAGTGTTFGEGAALVMLKRLEDAIEDGDHIYSVILGVGLNNDGAEKVSYTAPSVRGQAEVISLALQMADVPADSITFIEGHGTATPLGDPIEMEALRQNYVVSDHAGSGSCALGSLKSNVGHMIHAAGTAGLIKAALAAERGVIPPTLFFETPNPALEMEDSRFFVPTEVQPWSPSTYPRRAAVSCFGVGGTNAHVILQAPPAPPATDADTRVDVLTTSAMDADTLVGQADRLSRYLSDDPVSGFADLAYTLNTARRSFAHRLAVVARDGEAAAQLLGRRKGPRVIKGVAQPRQRLAMVFPGQGTQSVGMGLQLAALDPGFKTHLDECLAIADRVLDEPLSRLLAAEPDEAADAALARTEYAQPAIFIVAYSLARWWEARGVVADVLMGHSIGEYVAACLAGVWELETTLRIVAKRGALMGAAAAGDMLAVNLAEPDIEARLGDRVSLAAVNGPDSCVLAGESDAIAAVQERLAADGVRHKVLNTSHAFHSHMMDEAAHAFASFLGDIQFNSPARAIISTRTGEPAAAFDQSGYWVDQIRQPVRFLAAAERALEDGVDVFLEVGPGGAVSSMLTPILDASDRNAVIASSLAPVEQLDERERLMRAAAMLWCSGYAVDWPALYAGEKRRRVPAPGYAFRRDRHWIDPPTAQAVDVQRESNGIPEAQRAVPNSEQPFNVEVNPVQAATTPAPAGDISPLVRDRLVQLIEEYSGFDLTDAGDEESFVELGLDSLLLTQLSAGLQDELGVDVSFRELMESVCTLPDLTAHVVQTASDQFDAPAAPEPAAPTPGPAGSGALPSAANGMAADATVQQVINEQLRVMERQLALLQGGAPEAFDAARAATAPEVAPKATSPDPQGIAVQASIQTTKEPERRRAPDDTRPSSVNSWDDLSDNTRTALQTFIEAHSAKTAASKAHTDRYRLAHADPRTAAGFHRVWKEIVYPLVCNRSDGARIWDLDGNEYIDLQSGFGPNLLGYSHPAVVKALKEQIDRGWEIGPQCDLAGETAQLVCDLTGMERASFVCTGSEAVQAALRCARTYTRRDKVVVFNRDYHGNFDEVLVRSNNAEHLVRTMPSAPGIPRAAVANIISLEYGHPSSLEVIRELGDQIAAVMVEPVQSRLPEFQPREFLHDLRQITRDSGSLLIFDEVVTGFRCHPGGAQAHFGVEADLATYGKVCAGVMPLGIVAGRRPVMDTFDGGVWQYGDDSATDAGVTFFAGTFVRHPLTIAACHATLSILKEQSPGLQEDLTRRTADFTDRVNQLFIEFDAPYVIPHFTSVMFLRDLDHSELSSMLWYYLRHHNVFMLEGFPSYMTLAHGAAELDQVVAAFRSSLSEMVDAGLLPKPRHMPVKFGKAKEIPSEPPVPGARLGKDPEGNPAWYAPDPERPNKYLRVS